MIRLRLKPPWQHGVFDSAPALRSSSVADPTKPLLNKRGAVCFSLDEAGCPRNWRYGGVCPWPRSARAQAGLLSMRLALRVVLRGHWYHHERLSAHDSARVPFPASISRKSQPTPTPKRPLKPRCCREDHPQACARVSRGAPRGSGSAGGEIATRHASRACRVVQKASWGAKGVCGHRQ